MSKITFLIDGQTTEVESVTGETVLQIGLEAGLMIESSCGGNGFCTTCICNVVAGEEFLSAINDNEENMGIDSPKRLSCQATIKTDGDIIADFSE